jgi:nucleoid-associated protein YgaU
MNRYKKTEIKLDKDGKRVYGTTYYPTIPIENTDKFIITTLDNRLDSLANQYYGDVSLWWVIAKANGIKGKTVLKAGELLRIPGEIPKILEEFDDLNGR